MGEVPSPTEELPSPLQLEEEANASDTAREVEGQPMRRPRTPPQVWRLDDSLAEEEDSIDGEFDEEQTAGQTACRLGDSKTGLPRATEHDLSTLAAALDDVLGSMATGVSDVRHAKLPHQGLSNLSNQPLAKHLEAPPHSRAPPSRAPPSLPPARQTHPRAPEGDGSVAFKRRPRTAESRPPVGGGVGGHVGTTWASPPSPGRRLAPRRRLAAEWAAPGRSSPFRPLVGRCRRRGQGKGAHNLGWKPRKRTRTPMSQCRVPTSWASLFGFWCAA